MQIYLLYCMDINHLKQFYIYKAHFSITGRHGIGISTFPWSGAHGSIPWYDYGKLLANIGYLKKHCNSMVVAVLLVKSWVHSLLLYLYLSLSTSFQMVSVSFQLFFNLFSIWIWSSHPTEKFQEMPLLHSITVSPSRNQSLEWYNNNKTRLVTMSW